MNLRIAYYTVYEGGHILETAKEISKEYLDNIDLGFDKIIMPDGFTFHSIGGPGWRWDSKNGFTNMTDMVGKDIIQKSERGKDWGNFAYRVLHHIETYTVPQYGDKGQDQCTEFTRQDFETQIKKYANRMGKNSRPGQDKLDLLKICHYAQMLHDLIED